MVRGAKLNNSSSNRRHPALMTQIRTCLALLAISHFINNSLQRGGGQVFSHNRFSVYSSLTKTAEAVEALSGAVNTQLSRVLTRGLVGAIHIPQFRNT